MLIQFFCCCSKQYFGWLRFGIAIYENADADDSDNADDADADAEGGFLPLTPLEHNSLVCKFWHKF